MHVSSTFECKRKVTSQPPDRELGQKLAETIHAQLNFAASESPFQEVYGLGFCHTSVTFYHALFSERYMKKITRGEELDPKTDFVRVNIFPPDRYGLDLVCPHQRILAARATLGILAYAQSGQAFL